MSRDMTNAEAIANLNHIYGMVSPDIQRSLDLAFKAMERPQGEWKVDDKIYCSECGESICDFIPNPNDAVALILENKFCFNCGAKMKNE